jgi:hypothetical protein
VLAIAKRRVMSSVSSRSVMRVEISSEGTGRMVWRTGALVRARAVRAFLGIGGLEQHEIAATAWSKITEIEANGDKSGSAPCESHRDERKS